MIGGALRKLMWAVVSSRGASTLWAALEGAATSWAAEASSDLTTGRKNRRCRGPEEFVDVNAGGSQRSTASDTFRLEISPLPRGFSESKNLRKLRLCFS